MILALKETDINKLQNTASDPGKSVWVNASAGSGKTKVLVDRVLRILLSGNEPDKILCITYTKAAASEMSERIMTKLHSWAICSEENLKAEINTLMESRPFSLELARTLFAKTLRTNVKICTIHSFCQEILSRFPIEAGLMPNFRIMEENDKKDLIKEEFNNFLRDSINQEAITKISLEWSDTTLDKNLETFVEIGKYFDFAKNLNQQKETMLESIFQKLTSGFKTKEEVIRDFIDKTDKEQLKDMAFDDYIQLFLTKDYKPRKTLLKNKPEHLVKSLEAEAQRCLKAIQDIEGIGIFDITKAITDIGLSFGIQWQNKKKSLGMLDYDDLIAYTAKLFDDTDLEWILYKLDYTIKHLLIDEAQDTNKLQWQIIHKLTDNFWSGDTDKTLFIVGDKKQSIYSFQGADRGEFIKQEEKLRDYLEEVKIDVSFRSEKQLLEEIDRIYELSEEARKGVDDIIQHHAFHNNSPTEKSMEVWKSFEDEEELAESIADKILCMKDTGEIEDFSDIMILVRTRSIVPNLNKVLREKGISTIGMDKLLLSEELCVQDLMSVIKFVLLPEDDLNLGVLLKTPFIGLDDKSIEDIAIGRSGFLWNELKSLNSEIVSYLENLIKISKNSSPFEFVSCVLNMPCPASKYSGYNALLARLGNMSSDSIDEFLLQAYGYSNEHEKSLELFIRHIEKTELEIKRKLEDIKGAVKIMTVHGAKGLEAPVVILPDTGKSPTAAHANGLLEIENDIVYVSKKPIVSGLQKHHDKKFSGLMEEYNRLLYVALTRAKKKLIICAGGQASEKSWYGMISKIITPEEE
ncbi:MAG: UvrD-helicase domain-containing protein [Alphaproteobacteria bacterium]|nr:UvrD-helicase domain-containing protein [Alphaproteobacteria bacterium]